MSKIKIVSDSTSDLSKELLERYNVSVLPLHVLLGDNEYKDGVNLGPDEIYKWADENKDTPKTSAPSPADTIEFFKKYLEEYDEIIAFHISGSMSSSGQIMQLAAEELDAEDRIHVIDSKNLSTGIGHLVVEAAEMAAKGLPAIEIKDEILKLRPYVRSSFVVDTLTYLHRGGRCSGLAALAGGVLKLHPRIAVADGAMHPEKKYRGKINTAVMDYVKDMEADLKKAKPDRVFITHSGCDAEVVENVRSYLAGLNIFKEIFETRAGSVISSHCGPGTLGVLYIEQAQEELTRSAKKTEFKGRTGSF